MQHTANDVMLVGLNKPEFIDGALTVTIVKGRPSSSAQCYELKWNESMQTIYAFEVDNPNKHST